jgi:hypothetical protein
VGSWRRTWITLVALSCATGLPTDPDKGTDPPTDSETAPPDHVDTELPNPTDTAPPFELLVVDAPVNAPVGDATAEVVLQAQGGTPPYDNVVLSVVSDLDGDVGAATLDGSGALRWATTGLSGGAHRLTFTDSHSGVSVVAQVGICTWPPLEDFTTNVIGADWTLFGHASWDPGGWLEITGTEINRRGALFKTSQRVNAGDVRIDFSFATGGGFGTGADGLAISIIDAADPVELASIVNAAQAGGCLGYGVSGACGSLSISAFHVEIDTWFNQNNPITDPTPDDHLAISLNGDPGTPLLWQSLGDIEDLVWRDVSVQTAGSQITVWIDGQQILDDQISGFVFEGGYIGVTGSTGAETNFHRFDDLQVYDRCIVPTPVP